MFLAVRFGVILALVAGFGAAVQSEPLRDGADAFAKNDYATAMHLLAPLAGAGDPVAGCMVTVMRDRIAGRVAYDADAMATTCIAAAGGDASAELDLAGDYRSGLIVAKDPAKAAALYRRAADQGLAVAQKVLGDLTAEGSGVARDFAAACGWWGRAAMQGENTAQRNYGSCYLTGDGVPRSEMHALAWWLIARYHARDEDKSGLPGWVFQGEADAERTTNALIHRMPVDQVIEAQALARAWRAKPE